jgi:hypothetical protein
MTTYEPISLGLQCETKYQLSRVRYEREATADDPPFHAQMAWGAGNVRFPTHIFDSQTTPFQSLVTWIERDFHGVFELDDLHIENGQVASRRLGTQHPHEFHGSNGPPTTDDLIAQYPAARSRFEHLAQKFRTHLLSPGPFLYVMRQFQPAHKVEALIHLLKRANPARSFHLLVLDWEGLDEELSSLPNVSKAWLPLKGAKPPEREWEGDDAAWDLALAPFAFTPTREMVSIAR